MPTISARWLAAALLTSLLVLGLLPPRLAAAVTYATPMTPCQCLQCFPSAIAYAEGMAAGYDGVPQSQLDLGQVWDTNYLVRDHFASQGLNRESYLRNAFQEEFIKFHSAASDAANVPLDCASTSPIMVGMMTNPRTCRIELRELSRLTLPCEDLYLATLSHEISHVQFCADNRVIAGSPGMRAVSEAQAYRVEADVLRALYLRRWRQCVRERQPTSPRVRFNDIPTAFDYLQRALNYEREYPLGSFPPASFRPEP